jgi:hypothetical protein
MQRCTLSSKRLSLVFVGVVSLAQVAALAAPASPPRGTDSGPSVTEDVRPARADGVIGGSDALSSGIKGQLVIGPIRPLEQEGIRNQRGYQGTVAVLDDKGNTVTQFQSDANGRFRVALKPGTYTLQPRVRRPYPRSTTRTVTVTDGQFTRVTIAYDSGIR